MSVKIQINSLEALDRLIGGNTDLEMEIRQSIVTEFTKRYLKGIVSDRFDDLVALARSEVDRVFSERIGKKGSSWGPTFTFNAEIRRQIDEDIKKLIGDSLHNIVQDVFEKSDLSSLIEKRADQLINHFVKERIDDGVMNRLKKIRESL